MVAMADIANGLEKLGMFKEATKVDNIIWQIKTCNRA